MIIATTSMMTSQSTTPPPPTPLQSTSTTTSHPLQPTPNSGSTNDNTPDILIIIVQVTASGIALIISVFLVKCFLVFFKRRKHSHASKEEEGMNETLGNRLSRPSVCSRTSELSLNVLEKTMSMFIQQAAMKSSSYDRSSHMKNLLQLKDDVQAAYSSKLMGNDPSKGMGSTSQPSLQSTKIGSTSQPTLQSTKIGSTSQPSLQSTKIGSTSQPSLQSTKIGSAEPSSQRSEAISQPSLQSTKIGSTEPTSSKRRGFTSQTSLQSTKIGSTEPTSSRRRRFTSQTEPTSSQRSEAISHSQPSLQSTKIGSAEPTSSQRSEAISQPSLQSTKISPLDGNGKIGTPTPPRRTDPEPTTLSQRREMSLSDSQASMSAQQSVPLDGEIGTSTPKPTLLQRRSQASMSAHKSAITGSPDAQTTLPYRRVGSQPSVVQSGISTQPAGSETSISRKTDSDFVEPDHKQPNSREVSRSSSYHLENSNEPHLRKSFSEPRNDLVNTTDPRRTNSFETRTRSLNQGRRMRPKGFSSIIPVQNPNFLQVTRPKSPRLGRSTQRSQSSSSSPPQNTSQADTIRTPSTDDQQARNETQGAPLKRRRNIKEDDRPKERLDMPSVRKNDNSSQENEPSQSIDQGTRSLKETPPSLDNSSPREAGKASPSEPSEGMESRRDSSAQDKNCAPQNASSLSRTTSKGSIKKVRFDINP